jgi:hypothetical protein
MQLGADALRFVLAQGLPAVIEVSGTSMAPTLAKGAKVDVRALAATEPIAVGDVVLVAAAGGGLLIHRVMAEFEDAGARFVVHQGDARTSTFAIAARADVIARLLGAPALDVAARARFRRRRLTCEAFVAARRAARTLHLADVALVRRGARAFRQIARRIAG